LEAVNLNNKKDCDGPEKAVTHHSSIEKWDSVLTQKANEIEELISRSVSTVKIEGILNLPAINVLSFQEANQDSLVYLIEQRLSFLVPFNEFGNGKYP
jgi:hypothetical protein